MVIRWGTLMWTRASAVDVKVDIEDRRREQYYPPLEEGGLLVVSSRKSGNYPQLLIHCILYKCYRARNETKQTLPE